MKPWVLLTVLVACLAKGRSLHYVVVRLVIVFLELSALSLAEAKMSIL